MEEKYIKFYENFHKAFDGRSNHCPNLISDSGVSLEHNFVIKKKEKKNDNLYI